MADSKKNHSKNEANPAAQAGFDPAALLSLYSLYGLGTSGGMNHFPTTSTAVPSLANKTTTTDAKKSSENMNTLGATLGLAASQAASLGVNQSSAAWWAMASQLAAQEYLMRIQTASRDSSAYAALAAQASMSNYASLLGLGGEAKPKESSGSNLDSLKLPSDTEIIKYTTSAAGPKNPGQDNRGRKKTISLEETLLVPSSLASYQAAVPAGLTIERKKVGTKTDHRSSPVVDKVEITKVPAAVSQSSNGNLSGESPLNLSVKLGGKTSAADSLPNEYYASQALSGVLLAEQIRQQQLAAALESRLESPTFSAMQAAMMLSKLKSGAEISAHYATASSTATSTTSTVSALRGERPKLGKGRHQDGLPSSNDKLSKDAVASLLAKSQEQIFNLNSENTFHRPELTIEPVFKPQHNSDNRFDTSDNGRRTTSVYEDGKLKIKTVSDSPEIRNLSDQDEANVSENESEEGSVHNTEEFKVSHKAAPVEAEDLRHPLKFGWKRETSVREYSKSGIRGEVIYYAPCGKKFKQYPDIMRYLEKKGIKELQREHFSFSTKIFVGDYMRPSGVCENGEEKIVRMSDTEMRAEIEKLRRENRWKPRRKSSQPKGGDATKASNENHSQSHETSEAKKKRQEEIQRLKEEEKARKLIQEQERRKKEALLMEQQAKELQRQQQLLYQQTLERERRRQHMVLMKQLEAKKRMDEYTKKREEIRLAREREIESRLEQRRLEIDIMNEMRKPVEDMSMPESKELPKLKRIPNLKLSGEAFANTLMIFEFLHNFGETLGFDMESLPNLNSLQAAMLNDPDYEEELLSVMIHLLVCAIEDPGIPNPQKHLTMLGQNLRQADITNTNVSEILRIYLVARAQAEMRTLHGLAPPEMYTKDRSLPPEKVDEYNALMSETHSHILSTKVKDKPFLSLNPTDKSEIVAFLCNDLLSNKAVVRQIDNNVENISKARKSKWEAEMKVRRLKMIQARRLNTPILPHDESTNNTSVCNMESEPPSEMASLHGDNNEDSMSVASESETIHPPPPPPKKLGRPRKHPLPEQTPEPNQKEKKKRGRKRKIEKQKEAEKEQEEEHESGSEVGAHENHDEEDEKLSLDELQKKIEKSQKQLSKRRDELTFATNCIRVSDLGQDRYRRRYLHFAHASGVYVEGLESAEPWKLATEGLPHYNEDGRNGVSTKTEQIDEESGKSPGKVESRLEGEVKEEKVEEKPVVNGETKLVKQEESKDDEAMIKNLGQEISITSTPKKLELGDQERKFLPKVTPNGDKVNMFNHTTQFNMALSPVILNGSVTITPKESNPLNVPSLYGNGHTTDRPWFSILPLGSPFEHTPKLFSEKDPSEFSPQKVRDGSREEVNPMIEALEEKLEKIRKMNRGGERHPIPKEFSYGWWRIHSPEEVIDIESALNNRGCREHQLLHSIKKNLECILESTKKEVPENVELENLEKAEAKIEMLPYECSAPDEKNSWFKNVALRLDKYILEQVEALEDKVQSASMQVPGWRPKSFADIESRNFHPACLDMTTEGAIEEFGPDATNPVEEAKDRLLDLEAHIERRYLKAPLGVNKVDISLQTITSSTPKSRHHRGHDQDDGASNGNDEDQNGDEPDDEENEEEKEKILPKGLIVWRDGLKQAHTGAQVAMAFYVLETSIAWHKSIMKAFCQLCHCGDDEDALLLCDGCDKGYHMYCFKPRMDQIPDGDWFCFECINKATGLRHCLVCGEQTGKHIISCSACPRAYHTDCLSPALQKVPRGKWHCPGCNQKSPRKYKTKKRTSSTHILQAPDTEDSSTNHSSTSTANDDESPAKSKSKRSNVDIEDDSSTETPSSRGLRKAALTPSSVPEKRRKLSKADKDLTVCSTIISELEAMDDAWPFLYPVNTKQFPTYKKVIKQPMDMTTIKKKLDLPPGSSSGYKCRDEFAEDVRLIFSNCELFNEDDSPVGKAGHSLRNRFEARWAELTSN